MNTEALIKAQRELIELLKGQIMDLTMMSKIELGDDVILEWKRLNLIIQENELQSKDI